MEKLINFNAGPAELPGEVLYEVAKATQKYKKTGMSILELPHRGADFLDIIEESKQLVRELCGLSNDYEIVWLHGGGRMQFCMVPMNFLGDNQTAAYIDSGHWAHEAAEYAEYYGATKIIATSETDNYCRLPEWPAKIPAKHAYLHITTNNTIYGTQWHSIPSTSVPLIADMSSDIFSARHDYTQYSLFYATAQKNLGSAGVALAVIHKDLLKKVARPLPPLLSYKEQVKENSIVNTANVPGIYTSLLMLRWIKGRGIENIERDNKQKASLLYSAIDNSKLFKARVTEPSHRSLMNVCFTADSVETEANFLKLCERNSITGLKGHRLTGGFRVSLYNAITLDAVQQLVVLMKDFENKQ